MKPTNSRVSASATLAALLCLAPAQTHAQGMDIVKPIKPAAAATASPARQPVPAG